MLRSSNQIERDDAAALGTSVALASLLLVFGAAKTVLHYAQGAGPWLAGIGGFVLLLRLLRPKTLLLVARPMSRGLELVGSWVGAALLSVFYVVALWPYSLALRALGVVERTNESWPPSGEQGWTPIDWTPIARGSSRIPGSLLARASVRIGAAVELLSFLRRRPSRFLMPLVVLLLLFGALALAGKASGLGPFVYTLF